METTRVLRLAILASLALLAGSAAGFAQTAREPVRIGLINEITGPLAVNGTVEDQTRFLDALRKVRFDAPGGAFRFDEKQNAIIPTYIRRVEKVGGKLQNTVFDVVPDIDQFWKPPKR